jgi:WbqC-like protein family
MILSAHQPVYLPWLGFLHKVCSSDLFVLMDDVKYSRNSVYARNRIRSTNGSARWLTVPVTRDSHERPINQVKIAPGGVWQIKHVNAIKAAYSRARFFDDYIDFFKWVYRGKRWENLFELNRTLLRQILQWYGIHTPIVNASDHRVTGAKSELIVNYCLRFGADLYLFGKSGRNYADVKLFQARGVQLAFQDYSHPVYDQGGVPFLANLSAIDLLFHHGPEAGRILMTSDQGGAGFRRAV